MANVPLRYPYFRYPGLKALMDAQNDVITAARLLALRKIPVVVINPLHIDKWSSDQIISPTALLIWIAQITKGYYFGFREKWFRGTLTKERLLKSIEKAISIISASRHIYQ